MKVGRYNQIQLRIGIMNIENKYFILFITYLFLQFACTWSSQDIELKGNCIIGASASSINTLYIHSKSFDQSYILFRKINTKPIRTICLNNVPESYFITSGKDTLFNKKLEFIEDSTYIFISQGGDRSPCIIEALYRNNKFEVLKKR